MATGGRGKSATLTINPHNQTAETVQGLMAQIMNMAGCSHCGRIAYLKIDFLGDPAPDLAKGGVISFQGDGF